MTRPITLLLAYAAFISLGLPDTVFGVAWPSIRDGFGLSPSAMGALLGAGACGYFLSGLLAGAGIRALGVGGLLASSSALVALSLLGFALAPNWSAFFPVGFVAGLGSGAIDSGLNGFAARHFSVRHVNWLHACWGVGASIGPLSMTAAIARGSGYRAGYAALSAVLATMALAFLLTRKAWNAPSSPNPSPASSPEPHAAATFRQTLRQRGVWLHVAAFLVYTGLESSVGQWCFTLLSEKRGFGVEAAGGFTAAYWASLTAGRVALGFVVDRIGPDRLLRAATAGAVLGALAFASSSGLLGCIGLLLLGASLAPVYPTLMARTPARLGTSVAAHAVGFQVSAATLGSTIAPALVGVLVARTDASAIGATAACFAALFFLLHERLLRLPPAREKAPSDERTFVA